jgi:two-component sensor histidine kinase
MRLVASELVTNALLHTDGSCTVTVGRAGHLVTLVVTDDSPVAPLRRDPEAMDDDGRGLAIVEMLSVAWGTTFDRAGTKSVWASFQIRAQAG